MSDTPTEREHAGISINKGPGETYIVTDPSGVREVSQKEGERILNWLKTAQAAQREREKKDIAEELWKKYPEFSGMSEVDILDELERRGKEK